MAATTSSRPSKSPMPRPRTSRRGAGAAFAEDQSLEKADHGHGPDDHQFPGLLENEQNGRQQTGLRRHGHRATGDQRRESVLGEFVALAELGVTLARFER